MNDIAAYYDRLATLHGHTPQAVDAPNQTALDIRYRILADVADMNIKTVLEVGCGHGGLGAYLTHRYPQINYHGIDISTELLRIGRNEHPHLNLGYCDFHDLPRNARYDIVVAQGIFYRLTRFAQAAALIRQMFARADEAVAFTALSAWKPNPRLDELHLDPASALALGRTITPRLALRHDYHAGDFAMYLYRKDHPK